MADKNIFIIAGEASGDLLGAELMQELKTVSSDMIHFSGVGGPQMTGQGLQSLFPMTDLSIMGLAEVLKHLPKLIRRFNQTVAAILAQNPQILITIDAPDFGLRVARKIKKLRPEIKLVHYVAPTVWAWRPGRAKKIAQYLDGLLCLFPFEPPYFEPYGLRAKFVGHPIAKTIPEFTDEQKQQFCISHGLDKNKPILCILPGSRVREVESLAPALLETVQRLKQNLPELQIIIPTMPHLVNRLSTFAAIAKIFVPKDNDEKYLAFASSTASVHASGTVALELALCTTPMVTIYKMSALSAWIGKRLIKTPYANLVNILLRHPVVPELIQEKVTADQIVPVIQALLTNETIRNLQRDQLKSIRQQLMEQELNAAAQFVKSFLQ
jgi:lipid-A-disaccharide synthase